MSARRDGQMRFGGFLAAELESRALRAGAAAPRVESVVDVLHRFAGSPHNWPCQPVARELLGRHSQEPPWTVVHRLLQRYHLATRRADGKWPPGIEVADEPARMVDEWATVAAGLSLDFAAARSDVAADPDGAASRLANAVLRAWPDDPPPVLR